MTEPARPLGHLWVVGAGRLGLALGWMLWRAGAVERLSYSARRPVPPPHPLLADPAVSYRRDLRVPAPLPTGAILAVPDDAIAPVAAELACAGLPPGMPVLHLSGALGVEPLAPLAGAGHPVGSLHPLVAVAEGERGAERLRGAWFALDGDGAARALGEMIAAAAGGRLLSLAPGGKTRYHAAAVFASNYVVALLAVAEGLLGEAGVAPEAAREALCALAGGAVANVAALGPAAALTGPVARGDSAVVEGHLARLSGPDAALYSLLARRALLLAREQGLAPERAARLEQVLGEGR